MLDVERRTAPRNDAYAPFAGTSAAARLSGNPIFEHLVASVTERQRSRMATLLALAEADGKRHVLRALLASNSHARRIYWSRKSAERDNCIMRREPFLHTDDSLPYDILPHATGSGMPEWYVAGCDRIAAAAKEAT